jgi:hypothetical protein
MNEPTCPIPQDDRQRLLRLYKNLQAVHIPHFESPILQKHANTIRECIKLLEDETVKAGRSEFGRK